MRSFVVAAALVAGLANTVDAQTYSYWAGGSPAAGGYVVPSYDPSLSNPYAYNPYNYNPYVSNPYASYAYNYNPYVYNPYTSNAYPYNPYAANAYPYVYASPSGRSYRRLFRRY